MKLLLSMEPLKLLSRVLMPLAILAGSSAGLVAQVGVAPEVEVRSVRFASVRPPNGGDAWLEALVELNVRGSAAGGTYGRFVDRVRVSIGLSIRKRGEGYEFFRSSAEAVSLEAGRAAIRFYLPPEIIRREQINSDPHAHLVEVAVGGREVTTSVSALLRSEEAVRSFRDRLAQAGPANDGVLVPQHESPFANEYPRDTPSMVRRPR